MPGEFVHTRPTKKQGSGFAAVADSLIESSAERAVPPCPHFGSCGGCALQHWNDAPYIAWKESVLVAALRRAGFDALRAVGVARTPPSRRRRIDLALRRDGRRILLGLHEARSGAVVDMRVCPVLSPELVELIQKLRDHMVHLSALRREGSAILNLLESGPDLLLRLDGELTTRDRGLLAAFAEGNGLARISWGRGTSPPEIACTLRPATTTLSGVTIRPPPGAFFQASEESEAAIVAAVIAGLPVRMPAKARLVELYAGCGTLSFALARYARVSAFEGDAAAADALRNGANQAGLAGRIDVATRDLTRQPVSAKELSGVTAVVLDPPFAGAVPQIDAIAASKVACVIYVSCNPIALASDARALCQAGYQVRTATLIDQFLWSSRIESVVTFGRSA